MLLHGFLAFLVFWRIWGAFSPPIRREFSAGNNDYAIALLTLTPTLAAQIVVVLPAGLGIDKQRPFPLISF